MIEKTLEWLNNLYLKGRPATLALGDASGRIYIRDDETDGYNEVERFVHRKRQVSNIESFTSMVIEEARRSDDGKEGDWMTVVFNQRGGQLHLDDRDGRQVFEFVRELAPQWQLLAAQEKAEPMEHAEFLRLLKRLRPSILEFPRVIGDFSKVSFHKGMQIDSSPELREGRAGMAYNVQVTAGAAGKLETALPAELDLELPFARGSRQKYRMKADISIDLDEDDAGKDKLFFGLLVPDLPTIEEQAIADEVTYFRSQVPALPRLHVLEDY